MRNPFGWTVAIFGVVWLGLAMRGIMQQYKQGVRLKWLVWVSGLLIGLGAIGFLGSMLMAVGVIKLPNSVEFPAGYGTGVVTTSNGKHVVPLEPSGRVQVYDADWKFLNGWQVTAEGGSFKVLSPKTGVIEVFTGRGNHYYTFSDSGELQASAIHTLSLDSLNNSGSSMVVPTSPLLWPFSSPFLAWGLIVLGSVGLTVAKRLQT